MGAPAGLFTSRFEYLFHLLTPRRPLTPAEVLHHRVITGGAGVGLVVAVPAGILSWLAGSPAGAAMIAVFGLGCLVLAAAARLGAPIDRLRQAGFGLVSAFLVAACLQTPELRWDQFKWLALVPMLSLFLDEMRPERGLLQRRFRGLWTGTALAVLLGLVVVGAHRMGWTFDAGETGGGMDTVVGLVDFVLFTVSVAGLLSVHGLALRRAQEELRVLRAMLPVCAWCRRIRDQDEGWVEMERYMAMHAATSLTHGICPDCATAAHADVSAGTS